MIIYICTCLYSHTVSYILYMIYTCVFIGGLIVPNSKGQVKLCVELGVLKLLVVQIGAQFTLSWFFEGCGSSWIMCRLLKTNYCPNVSTSRDLFQCCQRKRELSPHSKSRRALLHEQYITTNTYMFQTNNSQLLHFHRFTGRLFCFRTFPGTHVPLAVILNAKPCWWLWIWPIVPWQADIETEDELGRWWLEVQKVLYKFFGCVILLMVVALFLFLGCQWLIPGKRHFVQ